MKYWETGDIYSVRNQTNTHFFREDPISHFEHGSNFLCDLEHERVVVLLTHVMGSTYYKLKTCLKSSSGRQLCFRVDVTASM